MASLTASSDLPVAVGPTALPHGDVVADAEWRAGVEELGAPSRRAREPRQDLPRDSATHTEFPRKGDIQRQPGVDVGAAQSLGHRGVERGGALVFPARCPWPVAMRTVTEDHQADVVFFLIQPLTEGDAFRGGKRVAEHADADGLGARLGS
jgi:hypothetical protein